MPPPIRKPQSSKSPSMTMSFCNGSFVIIGDPGTAGSTDSSLPFYRYDSAADQWIKEPDLPYAADGFDIAQSNGKLYVMFGFAHDASLSEEEMILSEVWRFDGEKWEQTYDDLKYVGRIEHSNDMLYHSDAITSVKNGLIFFNASVDGGNLFLYNTETEKIEPLYYTICDSLCDGLNQNNSCVVTRDGIYFIYYSTEPNRYYKSWNLCLIPADSGVYESPYEDEPAVILGDVDGDGEVTIIDATAIQRHLASLPVTAFNQTSADADGDGEVTILDATAIQRHLADLPANENIGKPV